MSMSADQAIDEYLSNGNTVTTAVGTVLLSPEARRAIYKRLVDEPAAPFHVLLTQMLAEEVKFRTWISEEIVQDDMNYYEGIYQCAFLLYRVGDARDTLALWEAKYINMDVGSSMGAEYFVGAGLDQTLAFLASSPVPQAAEIAAYLHGWFDQPGAITWQEAWERERASNIACA
ncbi:hypothetical protein [Massilia frigida]|uniref:hypothetical protein n=1 Tax=Massilia frigida TaxID=2609281 RepID=UPI00141F1147|nr:hypothetical protein [Massilia frigida]